VFNIDTQEFIVILLVALLVLGPDRLPGALRTVGRIVGELKRMSGGFQSELRDALAEPLSTVNEMKSTMQGVAADFRNAVDVAATQDAPPEQAVTQARGDETSTTAGSFESHVMDDITPEEAQELP
jgi:sec-independent protein translocase protein TatB